MLGRDVSPLLSSLGIAALAGAVAPACSDRNGGPAPIDDVSDVIDVQEGYAEFYCGCYAELYGEGPMGIEDCLSELEIASADEEACLNQVFGANPADFEVLRCQAEAQRGFLSCARAEGCPPTFTCGDGSKVPEDYICDGDLDCEDGSDEEQNCPAPRTCEDGMPLEGFSVCDGIADCAGGEDEVDCPGRFQCGDGSDIPPEWVCDDDRDCDDGSDEEQNCPVTCRGRYSLQFDECGSWTEAVQQEISMCFPFQCYDGEELALGQRCDGTPDCTEGEDEEGCDSSDSDSGEGDGGESTGG